MGFDCIVVWCGQLLVAGQPISMAIVGVDAIDCLEHGYFFEIGRFVCDKTCKQFEDNK